MTMAAAAAPPSLPRHLDVRKRQVLQDAMATAYALHAAPVGVAVRDGNVAEASARRYHHAQRRHRHGRSKVGQ
jgi:hypothetical protein